ncbi:MAG: hypothetical protein DKT66_20575 [Candidatus Melainabacteria bacterium]|nr:MAG: hypothetical protein DKT66_20575 [Candidatus Melainabacteria bacterium]
MERFESCEKKPYNSVSYADWLTGNIQNHYEFDRGKNDTSKYALPDFSIYGGDNGYQPVQPAERKSETCLNSGSEYAIREFGQEIGDAVNQEVSKVVSYVMFNNYREREFPSPNIHPPAPDFSKEFVKEEFEMVQAAWDRLSNDHRAGLRLFSLDGESSLESLSPLARFKLSFVDRFAEFEKQRRD